MENHLNTVSMLKDANKPTLLIVNSDDVEYVWHEVKPLIEKALAYAEGELYSEDVLQRIFEETQTLWVGMKDGEIFCAGVTEIITYPRKRVLRIITFATKSGHDYEHWKDFVEVIEGFGVRHGCSAIEAWTRKGLARKLKWDNEYSVITKDIKSKWQ
jgi:hypothetical protein